MTGKATGWVFDHSPYSGNALVVHLALADVANDMHDWELWMSHAKLAEKSRTSVSTVQRAMKQMVEDGYLEPLDDEATRKRRMASHQGLRYRFLMPSPGQPDQAARSLVTGPVGQPDRARSVTGDRPNEPKSELKLEPKPHVSADAFEAFWTTYPKRTAKGAALKAWEKAVKTTSVEVIMAGVARYADERRGQDPTYTAHPATWLNAQRWLDEPTKPGRPSRAPKIITDRSAPSGEYDPWEGIE